MLSVFIPAHNEEPLLGACLRAAQAAAAHPRLAGEAVDIMVVLDSCTDATASVAESLGVSISHVDARNVGVARAHGAQMLIARGARWLAFTDADTVVADDWLAAQLELQAEAVCGTVGVSDWTPHGVHAALAEWHFSQTYCDVDSHRHVHGANLGVSTQAYLQAGGFSHVTCSEDVALVDALQANGARIAWSARPRVTTSARRMARTTGGFADALILAVAERLATGMQLAAPNAG